MFRRVRKKPEDPWHALAATLGLEPGDAARLLELLDLDEGSLASDVWQVRDPGAFNAYLFGQLEEAWEGGPLRPAGCCLLVPESGLGCPPLRVTRRLRDQQAGFQANATQADLITTGDEAFDAAYVVVSRDAAGAGSVLTGPVRAALTRLLDRSSTWPSLMVNGQQLLYSAPLPPDGSPAELGDALTDVLLLGVALQA